MKDSFRKLKLGRREVMGTVQINKTIDRNLPRRTLTLIERIVCFLRRYKNIASDFLAPTGYNQLFVAKQTAINASIRQIIPIIESSSIFRLKDCI